MSEKTRICRGCKKSKKPDEYKTPRSRSCIECVDATAARRKVYHKNYVKPEKLADGKSRELMAAFLYGKLI